MIVGINYANELYSNSQKLNTWSQYHKGKVSKVIEYSPDSLDNEFKKENAELLSRKRGNGYWLWKPYIVLKTLSEMKDGEYLFYCDSGAVVLKPIQQLVDIMERENQKIMCFSVKSLEKHYTKRDAFILMDCDKNDYTDTKQRLASYFIINNCQLTRKIIEDWLKFNKDPRIVTDDSNVMGKDNYEGFIENRHDQTVWSLLTKKYSIPAFRDPSQFGKNKLFYDKDVQDRSTYPVMIDSHRIGYLKTWKDYRLYVMRRDYPNHPYLKIRYFLKRLL